MKEKKLQKEKSMKKQVITHKIVLNKETLSNLNPEEMQKSLGGMTYTCPGLNCPSIPADCS